MIRLAALATFSLGGSVFLHICVGNFVIQEALFSSVNTDVQERQVAVTQSPWCTSYYVCYLSSP